MSTKTAKLKTTSANGSSAAKRSKSTNGNSAEPAAKKKSINERWIEKYGVDDTKAAKALRRAWQATYESHQKKNLPD